MSDVHKGIDWFICELGDHVVLARPCDDCCSCQECCTCKLTCPECDAPADDRVLAGMKCGRCAYPQGDGGEKVEQDAVEPE